MLPPSNEIPPESIKQALGWILLRKDKQNFDENQQRELEDWLQSEMNRAAFQEAIKLCERVDGVELPERTIDPVGSTVVHLSDRPRRNMSQPRSGASAVQPRRRPLSLSRREVLGGIGAGVAATACVGGAVGSLIVAMPESFRKGNVVRKALDGVVMHVARGTKYHIQHTGSWQIVHLLRGPAAFHVHAVSQRPLMVWTPLSKASASAARFSVLVEDAVTTTVADGLIRHLVLGGTNEAGNVVGAAQTVTVSRSGRTDVQSVRVADVEREFSWTRGELVFNDVRIDKAVSMLNHFNDLQVDIAPDVAGLTIGHLRVGVDKPEHFVDRITAEWGLISQKDEDGKILRIFRGDGTSARPPRSR